MIAKIYYIKLGDKRSFRILMSRIGFEPMKNNSNRFDAPARIRTFSLTPHRLSINSKKLGSNYLKKKSRRQVRALPKKVNTLQDHQIMGITKAESSWNQYPISGLFWSQFCA